MTTPAHKTGRTAGQTCGCLMCIAEGDNSPHQRRAAPVFIKRPVAFRVKRVLPKVDGSDEWRLFNDEAVAREEAEQIDGDYQALFVRDGTAITIDYKDAFTQAVEHCIGIVEQMAAEQTATNEKYPDHAKAYPSWVDRIFTYQSVADRLRAALSATRSTGDQS